MRDGSVAERSKALVLGTSLLGGVGSNPTAANLFFFNILTKVCHLKLVMRNETAKLGQKLNCQKNVRGHTDLNHGPIGLQPIALPLSYIPIC